MPGVIVQAEVQETNSFSQLGLSVSVCAPFKIKSPEKKKNREDCHPSSPLESGGLIVYGGLFRNNCDYS